MKALILAGGRGKRLEDITTNKNKCLLELVGKPIIEYNLERVCDIEEIDEIVIVVGYGAEDIINRYGIEYGGKRIVYAIQPDQKGLVHAIECAKDAIGGHDFFLLLGDEVLQNSRHREMLENFEVNDLFGLCGVLIQKNVSKISRTYTVLVGDNDRIFRLIEKPKKALNDYQGTGHCIFRNEILDYIERTPIHPERGERELPDLIQCVVDDGHIVNIFNVCDDYTNINSEEDLREAGKMMEI